MRSPDAGKVAGVAGVDGRILQRRSPLLRKRLIPLLAWVCLVVALAMAEPASGQAASEDDAFPEMTRRVQSDPIDRINEALKRYGRVFLWIGVGLSAILVLKIVGPVQIYYGFQDRRLRRAVWGVDDLLKRIQKEAEVTTEAPKEETAPENGLLAGMLEVAEFEQGDQVPSYVLTVNDLMLDNIAVTLRKLRRFGDGSAEKYQANMFTVVQGIKTITEQSEVAGVPSGLAVDVREYFKDEHRYKTWRKVLGHWTRNAKHGETADAFLMFMRKVQEGRPTAVAKPAEVSLGDTAVTAAQNGPDIPEVLNEETLPDFQKAAVEEAHNLCTLIRMATPVGKTEAWQFELVRRQQQIRPRDEAQRMLSFFLICERKTLQEITKIKMLPCRTWEHVLHVLGVEDTAHLHKRATDRLLTTQEVLILEKAFLQTFAKRQSLVHVYGQGQEADLMMDAHLPEIRREALALLRRSHQAQPDRLEAATEALNEEETPQNGQVKKLIEHYMNMK